jgi:hypothetical protein
MKKSPPSRWFKVDRTNDSGWVYERLQDHPDWLAAYRLSESRGRRYVSEVRVTPYEEGAEQRGPGEWSGSGDFVPEPGITQRILREVGPRRIVTTFVEHSKSLWGKDGSGAGIFIFSGRAPRAVRKLIAERIAVDRRRASLELRALVADAYVRAIQSGAPNANQQVSEEMAQRGIDLTSEQVRDRVRAARVRDPKILTPTGKGLPGGELTDYGKRLVDEIQSRRVRRKM